MRRTKLVVLFLFAAVAAYGQMDGPPPPPDGAPHMGGPGGGPGFGRPGGPGGIGGFLHPWKVVTGAPYSATATEQFSQTLAGGNTIQNTTTAQVARDSQGRTYTQQTLAHGAWSAEGASKTVIFISDPVAGYMYVLHPDKKEAIRRAVKAPSYDHAPDANGEPKMHSNAESRKDVVETDLGSKAFSGAGTAQGKSITHTIPAGQIGNAQAIVSTSEIWYSPDLKVVISSKHSDPRNGESTYTLSNIHRGEPNASLFQVPSDYTVKDASTMHHPQDGPDSHPE